MKKFNVLWVVIGTIISAIMLGDVVRAEASDLIPEIYIKAINPGYTVDGKSNVGEMIEIGRKESDTPISLAGLTVRYTNSSGNDSSLFTFPDNSYMAGELVLLRLASSPDSELANATYSKTLAMSAKLTLMRGEEEIDAVCWTGKEGCYKSFISAKPTTLVRNLETGGYEHLEEYELHYDKNNYKVEVIEEEGYGAETRPSQCKKLVISEILSYYETSKTEQFIELYNAGSEQILLDGCNLSYKNKKYSLSGIVRPEEYYVYYPSEFSLTKNPTNMNTLEIIDTDGTTVYKMNYPNGQRKGAAYALVGYDEKGEEIWRVTYAPTPGSPNNYQEYRTCEAGKVINEATGNCVKVTTVAEKVCQEGYYLNILTGRCKKIETKTEKTCKEGYYLNPETGRCRKIVENKSADYSIEPEEFEEKSSFVALYAVLGVVVIGMIYLIYEFRHQIVKLGRRILRR
ncbi:lamin tail domain-containing protein [Candidatus Saccharibacteria bacterium]|nr:lamin tail domain-containing protein [Candidatus Saccharibacteria bacterium]